VTEEHVTSEKENNTERLTDQRRRVWQSVNSQSELTSPWCDRDDLISLEDWWGDPSRSFFCNCQCAPCLPSHAATSP